MVTIHTAVGREIECDLVIRSVQYTAVSVYTHSITPIQAYQIFGNPEESSVLTVTEEGKDTRVYRGFTEIFSVQKDGLIVGENEILIILMRPQDDEYEEVVTNGT